MIIKVSNDRGLVAIEMSAKDRFYAGGNFATCTIPMEEFLAELERVGILPPRLKAGEHQAQGLLELVWEDEQCGR